MTEVREILEDRGHTHGEFTDQSRCTQLIKEALREARYKSGRRTTHVYDEALDMIAHKMARIVCGNPDHVDHWDDIAGYATLVADRIRKTEGMT